MIELLSYDFFQNALIAAIFAAISCGIIGSYIVSKRIVFISGGITHASFGGVGLGYFMGFNPLWGAGVFAVLASCIIEFLRSKSNIREDSAIGIIWAAGMALGILMVSLTPGYAPDLMSYLFGDILTVQSTDLWAMGIITAIMTIFFIAAHQVITAIAFDESYAKTLKLPVKAINYIIAILIALTIVANIRISGIILVISLMTIPQATAQKFTHQLRYMMLHSIWIGFLGLLSGLYFSYLLDIPSGASIILSEIGIFVIVQLIGCFIPSHKTDNT
ncbi:metal ABC transporter permease [Halosquirtibacter laminarini]|uniref:Metal ABC transporter permease n=1 Tax=Halosquirtibacter laminarini TaxID=3374600 RepID=A0AC61NF40_9BACT|nr:metal ABC transporter permease [Prolixibacteraceae bacterium]